MEHGTTERSWTIRPLTETDIEAYLDIYLNSYPAYKSLDEECRQHYRDKHRLELREDRQVQTVGLFEGGTLLATMKLIRFSMNFFGKMQPACGLMALEVHPLHKKKGVALEMVRYFEDYARRIGALLTLLLPFQIGFYRRMGYGFAGKLYEYHLPTAALPKIDAAVREHLRLMQPEDFDAVIAANLRGTFLCMKAVARQMVKQRYGRIVNLSSVVGLRGNAGQVNYAASKAGVIGMTKSLAKELAGRNITVNAVAPGFIDTDMTAALTETAKNAALGSIPMGRMGTPENVAKAVAFLAGEDAGYITGQVLAVDGGMSM